MSETINPDGDIESRTNDNALRWTRIDGIVQYGAVPESTPQAIAVAEGAAAAAAAADAAAAAAAADAAAANGEIVLLARAMVLGLTAMTETDLLAEASH